MDRPEWICMGCAAPVPELTEAERLAGGTSKQCACGWSYLWDAEGMHGRSPEAGPHPANGDRSEPVERSFSPHGESFPAPGGEGFER